VLRAQVLSELGVVSTVPATSPPPWPSYLPVMLDGCVLGYVKATLAAPLVHRLRQINAARLAAQERLQEGRVILLQASAPGDTVLCIGGKGRKRVCWGGGGNWGPHAPLSMVLVFVRCCCLLVCQGLWVSLLRGAATCIESGPACTVRIQRRRVHARVQGSEEHVPADLEVVHIPFEQMGPFPGVFLYAAPARMLRPVRQLDSGALELIGALEQFNMSIRSAARPPPPHTHTNTPPIPHPTNEVGGSGCVRAALWNCCSLGSVRAWPLGCSS
jgi:RNA polymerase I, Rpa2 specific domain